MRFAFVNPAWDFHGSTYFGCKEPHFPLELMYPCDRVRAAGHDALLVDAQMLGLSLEEAKQQVDAFAPDFLIVPTAPSYLFWRCPQPELRVPAQWIRQLGTSATTVAIGPHGSVTPAITLRKTGADIVLRGEADHTIPQLAEKSRDDIAGCCWMEGEEPRISEDLGVADVTKLKALDFGDYPVEAHGHRHHVFTGHGRGAELEFARGCPWSCSFCNKTLFRNKYRERDVEAVLQEIDQLIGRGVDYIYFIDEIFGVGKNVRRLLHALAERPITIGFQTRIDLWDEEGLDLLARAHCISVECGIESITDAGRDELNKGCRMTTERMSELLIYARQRIPWVQANLILTDRDDKTEIKQWQARLKQHNVWVSEPVPMFPFPGSPLYIQTFNAAPDDRAWERAHDYYLQTFNSRGYSDIQEQQPLSIQELEGVPAEEITR